MSPLPATIDIDVVCPGCGRVATYDLKRAMQRMAKGSRCQHCTRTREWGRADTAPPPRAPDLDLLRITGMTTESLELRHDRRRY